MNNKGTGGVSVNATLNALEIFDKGNSLKRVSANLSKIEENCEE